ncbi:DUF2933 domain-containing protein [Pseudoroseomonas ludipueritiae]|jgi:hypothetical protein|uniref:DUF2933 domain-containing protein n=1 Tax=Pseudoroseomonas ludipueritiae TaxID=198093 RepID=A0ABR7R2N8_9PROT|nr:DUF2933 domain-containing protein [Pseudoroseomonas ludipueritiae]MBC9175964.1 DUF2933 domain-containing protein [Pseudoroseomonas ludipueritiae]MCG7362453.1 DUF2933 domain-containing protein [Roseomonas sp. ACRSG]
MHDHAETSWWRSRTGIAVIGLALVAAFYVLREHYAHVFGVLPYLLLLACPLMHLFMHHGHGGHAGHGEVRDETKPGAERGRI